MQTFTPKKIEGFETGLPLEIEMYLHLHWIKYHLYGPNGNLTSSWQGVERVNMFVKMDESYQAQQYRKTTGDSTDHSKDSWRNQNFSLR